MSNPFPRMPKPSSVFRVDTFYKVKIPLRGGAPTPTGGKAYRVLVDWIADHLKQNYAITIDSVTGSNPYYEIISHDEDVIRLLIKEWEPVLKHFNLLPVDNT